VDLDRSLLEKSREQIATTLERVGRRKFRESESQVTAFIQNSLRSISESTDLLETVKSADIVIEAIVENLAAKQKMFQSIDGVAKPSAIFASNTSALPIRDIAMNSSRLDRFCGLHFFNPVAVMKLLEVICIPETSEATYRTVMDFGSRLGKTCVTCKDTPGFIVNRLLLPYMAESIRMLERGDATKEDIDTAMKLGAGYPMGPFELSDLVGIDTMKNARDFYHKTFPNNELFFPSPLINKMVEEGKLGLKTGEGFYCYK
jgi:3-hydroxyacyl-CoA dehydrogenase